jgi:hypothetical protein
LKRYKFGSIPSETLGLGRDADRIVAVMFTPLTNVEWFGSRQNVASEPLELQDRETTLAAS